MTETTATEPTIIELTAQPTVAVRVTIPMAELDLSVVFGRYPPLIVQRLAAAGTTPGGPMFGRYHQFGPETVDVEVGLPAAAPPAGIPRLADQPAGEVGTSELPGGPAAMLVHEGGYEGLAGEYDRLLEWIHAQGREEGAGPWERYRNTPLDDPDPANLRTDVWWPLA
jgi:effector-binding domain-containing protein